MRAMGQRCCLNTCSCEGWELLMEEINFGVLLFYCSLVS